MKKSSVMLISGILTTAIGVLLNELQFIVIGNIWVVGSLIVQELKS